LNDVVLTLDVDWVPDPVLAHVVDAIAAAGVRATLFATHATPVLAEHRHEAIEVALHPHFDRGDDLDEPLRRLKAVYPNARGARSHGLSVSSHMLLRYVAHGLQYESNIFLPGHPGLQPVRRFEQLVSIPFYWSDDKHLERREPFDMDAIGLDAAGLKVLNFHPIHVYMNTVSPDHYASFKADYQDADALVRRREPDVPGIGRLFERLLAELSRRGEGSLTLADVSERHFAAA
jgi:hypothetical protein